jgi:hypothetical protein
MADWVVAAALLASRTVLAAGWDRGMGRVVTARNVAGGGAAAALIPVGEDETAFHGASEQRKRPPVEATFFFFYPIRSGYHIQRVISPNKMEGIKK